MELENINVRNEKEDNEQKHFQVNQHNWAHTMQNNNCMHIT